MYVMYVCDTSGWLRKKNIKDKEQGGREGGEAVCTVRAGETRCVCVSVCVCVCVCVWCISIFVCIFERGRERERGVAAGKREDNNAN